MIRLTYAAFASLQVSSMLHPLLLLLLLPDSYVSNTPAHEPKQPTMSCCGMPSVMHTTRSSSAATPSKDCRCCFCCCCCCL
jgi:hypothetical protein